jgi:hypothetical protein
MAEIRVYAGFSNNAMSIRLRPVNPVYKPILVF